MRGYYFWTIFSFVFIFYNEKSFANENCEDFLKDARVEKGIELYLIVSTFDFQQKILMNKPLFVSALKKGRFSISEAQSLLKLWMKGNAKFKKQMLHEISHNGPDQGDSASLWFLASKSEEAAWQMYRLKHQGNLIAALKKATVLKISAPENSLDYEKLKVILGYSLMASPQSSVLVPILIEKVSIENVLEIAKTAEVDKI